MNTAKSSNSKTVMPATEISRIREMLSYRRPARSATEESFITKYIDSIPGVYSDNYGNRLLICPESRVMISVHTDSVHKVAGKQAVTVSRAGLVTLATLAKREKVSNCLGADDCAGVYAALRMIEAGVKATFVFHRDEESGGNGSHWLAQHYSKWLESFDMCLALDRRGTKDIITAQSWSMSASEEFAKGLAAQLGMGHAGADGVFTDSANYTDLIPECSNLSIGYQYEHSTAEMLDLGYLEAVIQALVKVDWSEVPIVREPGARGMGYVDFAPWSSGSSGSSARGTLSTTDNSCKWDAASKSEWDKWLAEETEKCTMTEQGKD